MYPLIVTGCILACITALVVAGCVASPTPVVPPSPPAHPGRVEVVSVPAPSLSNNAFREPPQRPIGVYLPPSYETSHSRYPVVYYLPGMGVKLDSDRGYPLVEAAVDRQITGGRIREMIVVVASGFNSLGASLYVNSPLNGNWEDFVAQDIVRYVDSHYRTLPDPASRGISGHSMGGYGALNLAMHHPDVFGAVYSLSPALFDSHGLADSSMFASPDTIGKVLDRIESIRKLPPEQAAGEFFRQYVESDLPVQMTFAYGAAFSPAPGGKPPYIDYPYSRPAGRLRQDPEIWARWAGGWGALPEKVAQYGDNLRQLKAIGFEYGEQDENAWIPRGCEYLAGRLAAAGIRYSLSKFEGTHYSRLPERIGGHLLPFFSETLASDNP